MSKNSIQYVADRRWSSEYEDPLYCVHLHYQAPSCVEGQYLLPLEIARRLIETGVLEVGQYDPSFELLRYKDDGRTAIGILSLVKLEEK